MDGHDGGRVEEGPGPGGCGGMNHLQQTFLQMGRRCCWAPAAPRLTWNGAKRSTNQYTGCTMAPPGPALP
jgi:hypothetical protein